MYPLHLNLASSGPRSEPKQVADGTTICVTTTTWFAKFCTEDLPRKQATPGALVPFYRRPSILFLGQIGEEESGVVALSDDVDRDREGWEGEYSISKHEECASSSSPSAA